MKLFLLFLFGILSMGLSAQNSYDQSLRLGTIFSDHHDYAQALVHFEKALLLAKERGRTAIQQTEMRRNAAAQARIKQLEFRRRSDLFTKSGRHFHAGKFGLSLKEVEEGTFLYGFVDPDGEEIFPFHFEEASAFSLVTGYSRVVMGGEKYLMDTLGQRYLLAERLGEMSSATEALDLCECLTDTLPEDFGSKYQALQIFLAYRDDCYSRYYPRSGNDDPPPRRERLSKLPASIGQLQALRVLKVSQNRLRTLPPEIGQLSLLESLDLSENHLSMLPPEIGQLNQLITFDLSNNQVPTLPAEIGQLNQLTSLDLRDNGLTTLPAEIGQLASLVDLWLEGNEWESFPPEVRELTKVKHLSLSRRSIGKLSLGIEYFTQLESLDLSGNVIQDFPPAFFHLTHLTELNLHRSLITELPPEIAQLSRLTHLDLSFNRLSKIPDSFGKLSQLKTLNLRDNLLKELPTSFSKLQALEELSLSDNRFVEIPAALENLPALRSFAFGENRAVIFPTWICEQSSIALRWERPDQVWFLPNAWEEIPTCYLPQVDEAGLVELRQHFFQQASFEQAQLITQELLNRAEEKPEYWRFHSQQACLMEEYEEALSSAQQALNLDATQTIGYARLAIALLLSGQDAQALSVYERWKEKDFLAILLGTNKEVSIPAKTIFLMDLDQLEVVGIRHPRIPEIRAFLQE